MEKKIWKILRADSSPYMSEGFLAKERELLGEIPRLLWVDSWEEKPEIVITTSKSSLSCSAMNSIKLIVHPNSGLDPFLPFLKSSSSDHPRILSGNKIRAQAVAQYILSCLCHRYINPPFSRSWDENRRWPRKLLSELEIYLIGHGHIGTIVAKTLKTLEAKVRISDPYKGLAASEIEKIDCLIVACCLNKNNVHLVNKKLLALLNSDATIINSARGKLICQQDLIEFLSKNPDSCAYLDVFEDEPYQEKDFAGLKNIFLTSHVAGVFSSLEDKMLEFEKETIEKFLSADETVHLKRFNRLESAPMNGANADSLEGM